MPREDNLHEGLVVSLSGDLIRGALLCSDCPSDHPPARRPAHP